MPTAAVIEMNIAKIFDQEDAVVLTDRFDHRLRQEALCEAAVTWRRFADGEDHVAVVVGPGVGHAELVLALDVDGRVAEGSPLWIGSVVI